MTRRIAELADDAEFEQTFADLSRTCPKIGSEAPTKLLAKGCFYAGIELVTRRETSQLKRSSAAIAILIGVVVVACLLLMARPACAQNATAADEIILPIVVHASGSPSWGTEINLFNFSDDWITILALFIPANQSDDDPNFPLRHSYPNILRIGPHLPYMLTDAQLGEIIGSNKQGTLILDACRDGASCEPTLVPFTHRAMTRFTLVNLPRQFRDISAEVRVYDYVETPKAQWPLATRGDSYLAIPYWATVQPSDGPVDIHGIRVDATHGTTIGFNNTSSYSAIMVHALLFDGLGVQRGHWDEPAIGPLLSVRRSVESIFPVLAATNRLNRRPAGTGWWVRVEFVASVPNELAAAQKDIADGESCFNGCPQFFAWASVTDNSPLPICDPDKKGLCIALPDVHFIMPEFEWPDGSRSGEPVSICARTPESCRGMGPPGGDVHSAAFRPAISAVSALCRVVGPDPHDGSWTIWMPKPGGRKDELLPGMHVSSGELKIARAACSGTVGQ